MNTDKRTKKLQKKNVACLERKNRSAKKVKIMRGKEF